MLVFILHSPLEIVHLSLIQELILNQRGQRQKHYDIVIIFTIERGWGEIGGILGASFQGKLS